MRGQMEKVIKASKKVVKRVPMKSNKKKSGIAFTKRPYAERMLIVVDRTLHGCQVLAQKKKRIVQRNKEDKSGNAGKKIFDFLTKSPKLLPGPYIARKAAEKAAEAFMRDDSTTDFDVPVMMIGQTEAESLKFPPGHYKDNTVYVGHPLMAEVYYPLAEFHRFLFEHKVTEAIRLLMSLGAKNILVEHETGWSKEFAGNLSLPIPQAKMTASISASGKKQSDSCILFRATLKGSDKPILPPELLWFPHEATWRQVAEGRIKYGLQEFSLVVSYTDDFGINANLAAKLTDIDLAIGGQLQKYKKTKWKIEGIFA